MHFDGCDSRPGKGIPQGDARVRKGAGVEDNAFKTALRPIVNLINQSPLVVALETLDFAIAEIRGVIGKPALQVRKRRMPVNFGFALAEPIEVGSVENADFFHKAHCCHSGELGN